MAYPFGGHPTLAQYIGWVHQEGGHAHSGYSSDPSGRVQSLTKITSKEGASVVVVGMKQADRLEPTKVAYLDRRLKVRSPWQVF